MATFAKEITISSGKYDLDGISGSYNPAAGDKIIITPIGPDGADANQAADSIEANIQAWLFWTGSTWEVKVSDTSYTGKVLVVIKT